MTDRKSVLWGITDSDDRLFLSKMCDLCDRSIKTGLITYSRFLSPREQLLVSDREIFFGKLSFFGGYDDADRRIVAFIPNDWEEISYPISYVTIRQTNQRQYSHRDYLGSVLGLGITRELTGDIAVSEDGAVMAVLYEIADFVSMNLTKVASASVRVSVSDESTFPEGTKTFLDISSTVSSLRLDCVLSAVLGKSRTHSQELISEGSVNVNYNAVKNPSLILKEGDTISARGSGKFKLETIGSLTKKGRTHIEVKKYI